MKKVLLISFFNSTNLGDKAIADTVTKEPEELSEVKKMDIIG